MKILITFLILIFSVQAAFAAYPSRKYQEGQTLHYRMKGINDGRIYEAVSSHRITKVDGIPVEEVSWDSLVYEGENIDLSSLKEFRQVLSLDRNFKGSMPDISRIDPKLMHYILGPVFDLMTFYVDLNPRLFDQKMKELEKGSTITIPYNKPSSWADGFHVILGEDCIDFRLTYKESDRGKTLLRVEHIPPASNLHINLPEEWMKVPVSDLGPNNWVQIAKSPKDQNAWFVSYGYEYFDVHIYIDPVDGKILYANMYNPVEKVSGVSNGVILDGKTVTGVKDFSNQAPDHTFRSISLELVK